MSRARSITGKSRRIAFVVATAICCTFTCNGDDLDNLRTFVADGISTNLQRVRSFQAHITEVVDSSAATHGKEVRSQTFDKTLFFDGVKWRQQITANWF